MSIRPVLKHAAPGMNRGLPKSTGKKNAVSSVTQIIHPSSRQHVYTSSDEDTEAYLEPSEGWKTSESRGCGQICLCQKEHTTSNNPSLMGRPTNKKEQTRQLVQGIITSTRMIRLGELDLTKRSNIFFPLGA